MLREITLSWVEYYGPAPRSCRDMPRTVARWEQPRARGALGTTSAPEYSNNETTRRTPGVTLCRASIRRSGPDAVEHRLG
jgi:hypothetical protein